MPNTEQNTLRQILTTEFYRIDQRLSEMTQQIDKLADRDMLRVDRVEQVKLRQAELLELLEELSERIETVEKSLQNSRIVIRHGATILICVVIFAVWIYWGNGG